MSSAASRIAIANLPRSKAFRLLAAKDRRDKMTLGMARDASRAKDKAREVKHKKVRQVGYRQGRYQRFKGRRDEAMEEEVREARRVRVKKSNDFMAGWLEAQAQANAEEGSPRVRPQVVVVEVNLVVMATIPEGPLDPREPVMMAVALGTGPLSVVGATLVGAVDPRVEGVKPAVGRQALITSFFSRGK
jgi:hypothetical protein